MPVRTPSLKNQPIGFIFRRLLAQLSLKNEHSLVYQLSFYSLLLGFFFSFSIVLLQFLIIPNTNINSISEGIKSFIIYSVVATSMTIFNFFLLRYLVARPLETIKHYINEFAPGSLAPPLTLGPTASTPTTLKEIEQLVDSINSMRSRIAEDITQREENEQQLRESEEKYRQFFYTGSEAIISLDAETYQVIDINQAAEVLYGYSHDEFLKLDILAISARIESSDSTLKEIVDTEGVATPIEYHLKKSGSQFPVEIATGSFIWRGRQTLFCMIQDISKHVEYEKLLETRTHELESRNKEIQDTMSALKTMQEQLILQEKMASLGGLVAGVAHEINTPIGIGVTAVSHLRLKTKEVLKMYEDQDMGQEDLENYFNVCKEAVEMISSNLNRASDLIKSFKRVAVDQSNEEKGTFRIKEYLDEILLSLRPKLKTTTHHINISCSKDYQLSSYPGGFSQIFTNLIMNSLDHGFQSIENGKIDIDVTLEDEIFCLKYSDNGKGIPKKSLKKIFDPFFTTKRGQGGTGLGLHIIYNTVTQQLGGTIQCESEIEKHTTFHIRLPKTIS